jgi:hypothetical protein
LPAPWGPAGKRSTAPVACPPLAGGLAFRVSKPSKIQSIVNALKPFMEITINNEPLTMNSELRTMNYGQSIKNNKLCETNPISEESKMIITLVITMTNNNKQRTMNYSKQTQTKPILSAVALAKADSNVPLKKNVGYYGWITSILLMKLKNQCKLFSKKMRSEKPDEKIMVKCCSVQ